MTALRLTLLLSLCWTSLTLAQTPFPATPDLRKVGRGQPVPETVLAQVLPAPGETAESTVARAATLARAYTAQEGFEACAMVCRNPDGQVALRLTTNHSQIACRTPRNASACLEGFSPTTETLHTHPHTNVVWANPVDAVLTGVKRGRRLTLAPDDFSRRDRANGPGYLVTATTMLYQDGTPATETTLAVEHHH